jgi:hypothetical protein
MENARGGTRYLQKRPFELSLNAILGCEFVLPLLVERQQSWFPVPQPIFPVIPPVISLLIPCYDFRP